MIPNIVKGSGISGAYYYAMGQGNDPVTGERLELAEGATSRATILGGQNFGFEIKTAEDGDLARRMMEFQGLPQNQASKTRKLERDCFHASLSWGIGQEPTPEEMRQAGQEFLKAVGLEKAQAVFIAHDDTDHRHMHIVASRVDRETGRTLNSDNDWINGQKWAAQWERDHGQERTPEQGAKLHGLMDAIEKRDAGAVLSYVTRDKATFQAWEVNRALAYGDLAADEREKFRTDIFAEKNVIGLSDEAGGAVNRYTTREALAAEMALQRSAATLAANDRHGVDAARVEKATADFTLKPEQADALRQLTSDKGLAILWGEAGTGKSHTLKAARAVYEGEGKEVIGLSWTNDVVQQMRGDGFKNASTIASEMWGIDHGRKAWGKNTVLIVDEAAMISTDNLAHLAATADRAGAKVILAGDDKQLSSIERGGMFETLRQSHGAAILKDVQRVKGAEQKAAWNRMHEGEFKDILQSCDKAGGIHWTTRQSDTLKEMAARYAADLETAPDKRRFMLAYTNADVATLNQHARGLHRQRGDLGDDQSLQTKTGAQQFAEGDRIQFTGNGRTQREKQAGLTNGRLGTVSAITYGEDGKPRVTVDLDTAKGDPAQSINFLVGADAKHGEFNSFKHGYAGTIYRTQGKTLDEVYVGYSNHWRSEASYVALTRHREAVHVFAARETVKDLDSMAKSMARTSGKRAATAYHIDPESAARADLETAVDEYTSGRPAQEYTTATPLTAATETEAAAAADQTAAGAGERALAALGDVAEAAIEGVVDITEKAIDALAEGLAGILGGGSAPAPKQKPAKEPRPLTAKEIQDAKIQAFLEAERAQRAKTLAEISRKIDSNEVLTTDEELQQTDRQRDRGGGISR